MIFKIYYWIKHKIAGTCPKCGFYTDAWFCGDSYHTWKLESLERTLEKEINK